MKTRVLMADDEVAVLDSLSKLLVAADYTVVGKAGSGREACQLAAERKPDAILLDIRMPDMDGLSATKSIMENNPAPIILCTAYCDEDLVRRAAQAGAFNYITKPFRLSDIMAAITIAITRYDEVRQLECEVGRLNEALENRKWIEKAKGIVMKTRGFDEKQAHRYLQLESQRRGQAVTVLARSLVEADDLLRSHNIDRKHVIRLVEE